MAGRVSGILQRLLDERKITRMRTDKKLVLKEIQGAEHDLTLLSTLQQKFPRLGNI